jgi:D-aminoacyl-tRNA deacylase
MIAVIQRVKQASVQVESETIGAINAGLLVLLGVHTDDNERDIDWMCRKVAQLRIFNDAEGKMNLSVGDIHGEILVVSQFTLVADARKGNRPSFIHAADPEKGNHYYELFCSRLEETYSLPPVQKGKFGAMMEVSLINDGPVTIVLDSFVARTV